MSLKLQILMALLSCAVVRAQCPDDGLEDGQSKCTSCSTYITCVGTDAPPMNCTAGTNCYQNGDTNAACLTPDLYQCVTCPADSFTTCDKFSSSIVVACVPGQASVPFQTCNTTGGEICQDGACVAGTGSGGTPDEQCSAANENEDPAIITYKRECTSGLLCSGGAAAGSMDCGEGQYFDPTTRKCQSLPVNNCNGNDDGKAPSRTDCTKFAVCQGGVQMAEFDCDPPEYVFDVETKNCVDPNTDPYTCADLDGCTFESDGSGGSSETTSGPDETTTAGSGGSETTTSSSTTKPEECTADNVNQRYPIEGDCKSFWVCRKTSSDSYAYIKSQCSGNLVYNPETTYCDLPENVPGCEE